MRDRFDIDQIIKITGLGIHAEQADGGANFDVACQIAVKKLWKIKEYESLEKQNRLLKLPCAVGDTVYVIPSETNYKLNIINGYSENNRVYEQILNRIEITKTGYLFVTCDGMASVADAFYNKTWFLTQEEAEAALEELERGKRNDD